MDWLKKNRIIVVLLICISIIAISWFSLADAADNATLYIKDITGDRSVLDDVTISGVLQDMYHGLEFEINNSQVNKSLIYYNDSNDRITKSEYELSSNTFESDGLTYIHSFKCELSNSSIYPSGKKIDIYTEILQYNLSKKSPIWNSLRFKAGSTESPDGNEPINIMYTNAGNISANQSGNDVSVPRSEYNNKSAFTFLNGDLYFTVPTTQEYKGTNGIFKVEAYADNFNVILNKANEYGRVKTIASFEMGGLNESILGLEAVDDKLVLIMIVGGRLTFRSYDPSSGELISELVTAPFDADSFTGTCQTFPDGGKLNLAIYQRNDDNETTPYKILLYSINVRNEITLLQQVDELHLIDEYTPDLIDNMYEVNGKLFVFANLSYPDDEQQTYYNVLIPRHYTIFVYNGSNLLYKGELANDSDEDYITDRRTPGGISYKIDKYRSIRNIAVRGK